MERVGVQLSVQSGVWNDWTWSCVGDKGGGAGLWNQVQIFTTFHPEKKNSHLSAKQGFNVRRRAKLLLRRFLLKTHNDLPKLQGGCRKATKKEADLAFL